MKILGIDPGSTVSGFAILEVKGSAATLVEAGEVRPSKAAPIASRLVEIAQSLEALVARCAPDESAVEDLFHALNAKSSLRLAHARGVILCVLARAGVPIFEYTPLQVKKAVSGYGLADKDSLRALVETLLRVPAGVLTRDSSDAAAIALCHSQVAPVRHALIAAERREARAASNPAPVLSGVVAARRSGGPVAERREARTAGSLAGSAGSSEVVRNRPSRGAPRVRRGRIA